MARAREELRELVAGNYPAISRGLLGPLLQLLQVARDAFGGDLEKLLIMLVVAVRTAEHPDFQKYTPEQLMSGEVPVYPSLGTNIRSVADSIGAPKETVRRKIAELVEAGWLVRKTKALHFTTLAYRELDQVRIAIERLAVTNFEIVRDLLRRIP
ncbi:MAG TPA: hypothetical protein VIO94_07985 [Phenylobacterium sp.]